MGPPAAAAAAPISASVAAAGPAVAAVHALPTQAVRAHAHHPIVTVRHMHARSTRSLHRPGCCLQPAVVESADAHSHMSISHTQLPQPAAPPCARRQAWRLPPHRHYQHPKWPTWETIPERTGTQAANGNFTVECSCCPSQRVVTSSTAALCPLHHSYDSVYAKAPLSSNPRYPKQRVMQEVHYVGVRQSEVSPRALQTQRRPRFAKRQYHRSESSGSIIASSRAAMPHCQGPDGTMWFV